MLKLENRISKLKKNLFINILKLLAIIFYNKLLKYIWLLEKSLSYFRDLKIRHFLPLRFFFVINSMKYKPHKYIIWFHRNIYPTTLKSIKCPNRLHKIHRKLEWKTYVLRWFRTCGLLYNKYDKRHVLKIKICCFGNAYGIDSWQLKIKYFI